jgi:lipopolysaccharide heptosyltransferase I
MGVPAAPPADAAPLAATWVRREDACPPSRPLRLVARGGTRTISVMLDRSAIRSILLMRLSAVGDVVNTLPAVSAVRAAFPKARIGYLVEDKAQQVVEGHPDLDEVTVFPKKRWRERALSPATWAAAAGHVRRIREGDYDVLLDFQGNLKGGLHAALSGIPTRIGFARGHSKEGSHRFTNVHVAPPTERILRAKKFLALLRPLGIESPEIVWKLPPRPDSVRAVGESLRALGLEDGRYALFHPGTSAVDPGKRWPTERFAELARRLESEHGLPTLVAWGPGERPLAEEVARASNAVVAMETRSLMDLAEMLSRARLYVGADSGPQHLASAVGAASVALLGDRDPAIYAPCNPRSRVVLGYLPDGSPSTLGIGVDAVLETVGAMLAEPGATPPGGARDPARSVLPA